MYKLTIKIFRHIVPIHHVSLVRVDTNIKWERKGKLWGRSEKWKKGINAWKFLEWCYNETFSKTCFSCRSECARIFSSTRLCVESLLLLMFSRSSWSIVSQILLSLIGWRKFNIEGGKKKHSTFFFSVFRYPTTNWHICTIFSSFVFWKTRLVSFTFFFFGSILFIVDWTLCSVKLTLEMIFLLSRLKREEAFRLLLYVSRLYLDCTENCNIVWQITPSLVWSRAAGWIRSKIKGWVSCAARMKRPKSN